MGMLVSVGCRQFLRSRQSLEGSCPNLGSLLSIWPTFGGSTEVFSAIAFVPEALCMLPSVVSFWVALAQFPLVCEKIKPFFGGKFWKNVHDGLQQTGARLRSAFLCR